MNPAMPETVIGGSTMKEAKRGRLRSVETKPAYDEKGKVSGYKVEAHHEPDKDDAEGPSMSPRPAESLHETPEGAMAKHQEHLKTNHEKFGGGKASRYNDHDADDENPRSMLKRQLGR